MRVGVIAGGSNHMSGHEGARGGSQTQMVQPPSLETPSKIKGPQKNAFTYLKVCVGNTHAGGSHCTNFQED